MRGPSFFVLNIWYDKGMKSNTKSSITLPPNELQMVEKLQKRLKMKTKVEVIRRGLSLLNEQTERAILRERYKTAVEAVKHGLEAELEELDPLTDEGLEG